MSAKRKNALGRGLGALLDDSPERDKPGISQKERGPSVDDILIDYIETNPFQPRTHFDERALDELAESIKVQGIIQPITVRKIAENEYQLISGERRLQASKKAGLKKVPAYIRTANDQQMLEMALIENIQRENLNAMEIALSYQRLIHECQLKQEELGDRVGKNRSTVTNYLRLLKLPPDIQVAVRDGKISMGHARALINIDSVELQLDLFRKVVNEDLSVRKAEELVREVLHGKEKKDKETKSSPAEYEVEIKKLQNKLSSHFGTKISIRSDGKKGEIKIPFVSSEDLERILEIIDV